MRKLLALAALALSCGAAGATPIIGTVAVAGADTYTTNGIHFNGPGIVLIGTGNFASIVGMTFPIVAPSHQLNFGSATGVGVFTIGGITMNILTLQVVSQDNMFLNISGTANMSEAGFDTTLYDYTIAATRPDGVSSYTMTAAPPTPVVEIGTLFLVGTGMLMVVFLGRKIHGQDSHA